MPSHVNAVERRAMPRLDTIQARRRAAMPRDPAGTRARLVAAAARIFNREGYHATDSNRIARAAGYAPASFYKHFRDKRAVFLAAYASWVATEWDAVRAAWAQSASRTHGARRVVRLVLAHHRRWAGFRRSLRALADTDPVVREFRNRQRAIQLAFVRALPGARDSPERRADDLFLLLAFERVADAVADGEAAALGASKERLARRLERLVVALTAAGGEA